MLTGSVLHFPADGPDGQAVPVASGGKIVEYIVIFVHFIVIPVAGEDGVAAEGAVGGHPHGDAAAIEALGDHVPLGGHHLLTPQLRRGGVQQNVHAQLAWIGLLDVGEHLVVVQVDAPPHPAPVQGTVGGAYHLGLEIGHHGVADAGGETEDAVAVAETVGSVGGAVGVHLLEGGAPLGGGVAPQPGVEVRAGSGVVEVAALVAVGAQGPLPLGGILRTVQRGTEAGGDVLAQGLLRLGGVLVRQPALGGLGIFTAALGKMLAPAEAPHRRQGGKVSPAAE